MLLDMARQGKDEYGESLPQNLSNKVSLPYFVECLRDLS